MINNLNNIGNILFELKNENQLKLIEINTTFNLRKEKIKHKTWTQSKIFSSNDKPNVIYIEELNKWYYNKNSIKNEVIEVELYNSCEDILIDSEEQILDNEDSLPENLSHYGYLVYNIINYNYISCKTYKSRLIMEQELTSERKPHMAEVYIDNNCEDYCYIKELNKWYYKPKSSNIEFSYVRLFNSLSDMQKKIEKSEDIHFIQKDENDSFRRDDITRLNINSIHKDLKKMGYILLEFLSINHIKYQFFDSYEEAEEQLTYTNQITKCYHKKNDENIIYIKLLRKWIHKSDKNGKLYSTDMDIPLTTINNNLKKTSDENPTTFKQIAKKRKLFLVGWVYYEITDENNINARHYVSSNELLNRLDGGGNESQIFRSKIKPVCFIKKLNKWYYYDKTLEKKDKIIKIMDENEIFE